MFCSFHSDEVPAGSVFHKKPVHLIRHTKSSAGIPESEYFVHRVGLRLVPASLAFCCYRGS
jgi:hypothetical protein